MSWQHLPGNVLMLLQQLPGNALVLLQHLPGNVQQKRKNDAFYVRPE